jgi:hypothetical protein
VLYESYFDTKEEHSHQLYYYIDDRFKAAFAQWLSSAEDDDRLFCQSVSPWHAPPRHSCPALAARLQLPRMGSGVGPSHLCRTSRSAKRRS